MEVLASLDSTHAAGDNRLHAAYAALDPRALRHFTHAPTALDVAVEERAAAPVPRAALARALVAYNESIGAPRASLESAAALGDPRALCVVTGQQAGLLGGPLYTTYKIITAVRVARGLAASTGRPVVPVLWLATEDHDFEEINHTYALARDGDVRRVSFRWDGAGRPIADLAVTAEVRRAHERYFAAAGGTPEGQELGRSLAPRTDERYGAWIARLFLHAFGSQGLVVLEPSVLGPLAAEVFERAFAQGAAVRDRLRGASAALRADGFEPRLDPEQAGVPFHFTGQGLRVRCAPDPSLAHEARANPTRFSADAALRPVLQDAILPTAVSVLGPGEIAYQAMLRPLYELFGVSQPLLLPRLTATLLTPAEAELAARTRVTTADLLGAAFPVRRLLEGALPEDERDRFREVRAALDRAVAPVARHAESLDPNLAITAQRALDGCHRAVARLEERMMRVRLSHAGISARSLQALRASVRPRGALQERTYPLPFLLLRHGPTITERLCSLGDPLRFCHIVAVAAREP